MCALIDLNVSSNYIYSFHRMVFIISYVCSISPTYHVLNDYDYDIIWSCYFYSTMNFKFSLNLFE